MASPTLTVSRMDSGLLRRLGYTHLPTNRLPLERRSRAAYPFWPPTCLITGSAPEDRVTGRPRHDYVDNACKDAGQKAKGQCHWLGLRVKIWVLGRFDDLTVIDELDNLSIPYLDRSVATLFLDCRWRLEI